LGKVRRGGGGKGLTPFGRLTQERRSPSRGTNVFFLERGGRNPCERTWVRMGGTNYRKKGRDISADSGGREGGRKRSS